MNKIGVIFFILLMSISGSAFADAVGPFEWYFGNDRNSTYESYVAGPVNEVLVPVTIIVNQDLPAGFFTGAGDWATQNGIPYDTASNWYMVNLGYPNWNAGLLTSDTPYQWDLYRITGWDWSVGPAGSPVTPVPDGLYEPVYNANNCTLNYNSPTGELIAAHPVNSFRITVGQTESVVPEPASLSLLGFGLSGLLFKRRKRIA